MLFGISKGGFAGPIAILAIPLMSMTTSPVIAAGILLPILILMDITALYFYWRKWDLNNIKLIIPPSLIGILIGSLTFSYISDDGVRIIIGTIAILFILFTILQTGNFLTRPTNKNKSILKYIRHLVQSIHIFLIRTKYDLISPPLKKGHR